MFEQRESPTIDGILDGFARDGSMARHPATMRRIGAIKTRLLAYLATDAQHALLADERILLGAEREFAPDGAFSRVFGAEVLLAVLPGFLEPAWLPRQAFDARAQVRFVELLRDWIVARGVIDADVSCLVYAIGDAARAARAFLRERAQAGSTAPTPRPAAGQGA